MLYFPASCINLVARLVANVQQNYKISETRKTAVDTMSEYMEVDTLCLW